MTSVQTCMLRCVCMSVHSGCDYHLCLCNSEIVCVTVQVSISCGCNSMYDCFAFGGDVYNCVGAGVAVDYCSS